MTRKEFQDALQKGLGRAVQHVRNSPPEEVRDDLAHACTCYLGYDLQCEGSRVPWLFGMIEVSGEPEFYRQKIISAMEQISDDPDDPRTLYELYDLLGEFAFRGDAEVLALMQRRFETASGSCYPHFGYESLFRVEGIAALIRLLRWNGKLIRNDETFWLYDGEIKEAEEKFGVETVQAALEKESLVDESVRLFLERLSEQKAERSAEEAEEKKQKPPPLPRLSEFVACMSEDWPTETNWTDDSFRDAFLTRRSQFMHSGRLYAKPTTEELEFAIQQILETNDPGRQFCLMGVFVHETMPRLEPRLLSLLDAPLHCLRWGTAWAFRRVADPLVRAKGLELIAKAPKFSDWGLGIDLLQKNYRAEDETLIRRALETIPPEIDVDQLHGIVCSLVDLIKDNAEFTFETLLPWIYENSPCSLCRRDSLKQMLQRNIATKELIEECRDDCYSETRELAEKWKAQHGS